MAICPICNGFQEIHARCASCSGDLIDQGRIMDYYDDYSAYMPIDQMKLEDGYASDFSNEECPHLLKCNYCNSDRIVFIKE
ncbi:hypothetical protein J2Z40_001608 [Cytobacillus eiseniae]|uniref:Uncharacterized protein n=1 Tax=Cytobacillus eiseniae TaxID=762947 RepID=A0ABS4RF80_9BACI|nr:hypothetical protein [Cytobacillus eiseniae]MBP2241046.1 hypothetical protein [Cytobacillus eiseniae]